MTVHGDGSHPGADLILASRSADKAREIAEILKPVLHAPIVTLDSAGIEEDEAEAAIEIHDTFLDNAHAKAAWFMRLTGRATIADDSGISVHALGGAPGVRSRRFAADTGLTGLALDRANNERLLHELRDTRDDERNAHYTCAAVLHTPDGRRYAALATCTGMILRQPRGSGGFGYDPLFLLPDLGLSFGEITPDEKHRRSHRARAFRALAGSVPARVWHSLRAHDSRALTPAARP
jgi:XTP/dITP diphosphohydrolase